MHSLAARQLRRFFKAEPPTDPRWLEFVEAVSAAYQAADDDRRLLERTLALASQETEDRYRALQADIAAREKAESARDAFFRASPDMLAIIDAELRFVETNPSWERTLGFSADALIGRTFEEFVHADDVARVRSEAQRVGELGIIRDFEFRMRHQNGSWRMVSAAATIDRERGLFFAVARDVTEQQQMARELAQAQKLEAVGQLASGVAHEINTPVQYVGDNVSFANDGFRDLFVYLDAVHAKLTEAQRAELADAADDADLDYLRAEVPNSLAEAREGLHRVAELVRALKEFAHPDAGEKSMADLNKAIERAVVLGRGEIKHVSKLELELAPNLPLMRCHIGSLSQVFLNLLVNAAHAVEERSQKQGVSWKDQRIRVATRKEGNEAVISISDTGCGIPDAIRDRIFEPFFTTKPMGKGSGQGLPLVRSVVLGHGGKISLDSRVGEGTTFELRLPYESDDDDVRKAA
ncbi:MAG: ATP-binding protein [Archangium sp.]